MIYVVVDPIAERVVSVFIASNDADARRSVVNGLTLVSREQTDGLELRCLGEVKFPDLVYIQDTFRFVALVSDLIADRDSVQIRVDSVVQEALGPFATGFAAMRKDLHRLMTFAQHKRWKL